jgi:hypothetical protein
MSYNGSGTFQINTSGQPVVAGTVISATAFNALTADLATGLSTAITKDGQTTTTARIPFAQGISSTLTTDSSSVSTGSIITAGGVGIVKNLYVGANTNIAGTLGVTGVATFSAAPIYSSLTASSAVATDASKNLVSVTNTGTGNNVLATSPTLVTPVLGAASATSVTVAAGAVGTPSITTTGDTNTGIFFPAADTIAFAEGGVEAARFDSSGNLGIGTTSPTAKVDNTGSFRTTGVTDPTSGTGLELSYRSTYGDVLAYNRTSSAFAELQVRGAPLIFGNAGGERMRITSGGDVGIGTTAPAYKLEVRSTMAVLDGSANIGFYANGTTFTQLWQTLQSTNDLLIKTTAAKYIAFLPDSTERMRIAANGIVTMSAYGAGAATFSAAGVISSVSDETWKIKDGVPVDTDSMLKKLEPGYWYYNDEKKETFGTDRQLGFYAQNVNAAIGPEAAPIPEEGKPWGYYDRSVLAITVMSLQKALATIESLTARINALENK